MTIDPAFATTGSETEKIDIRLSYRIVRLFSEGLYASPNKAIEELVRENLHLIERWTRTDADTLEYVVTMSDPTTWTKPWTVKQEYNKLDDQFSRVWKEPRCHEGNFAMIGMLAGMRAAEQAFAEGRGPNPATINTVQPTSSANTIGVATGDEDADPLQ